MNNFFSELKRRNVVRVAIAYAVVGWVILQFVDIIKEILTFPDWFSQMVLVLLIIGLPIALLLSWAYEVTPEGVMKTAEVDKSKSVTHGTGQRINKLIAAGFVLALGFIAYDKMIATDDPGIKEAKTGPVSIAVLPFTDLSQAGDQEYFGDGMAEEILNILAGVEGLVVTSRTTAFSLKGKGLSIPEMADQLGVSHIVEGSIRSAGNRVRITAQLIKTDTDTHLWSETYDREMTDIFAIQDDISGSIASALKLELFGEKTARENPTDNLEAYQLYLQGRHLIFRRGQDSLEKAIDRLQQAVALDPDFAAAWADLAVALLLIPSYAANVDQKFYQGEAHFAADRALALEPDLAMAVAVKGFLLFRQERFQESLAPMARALKLDPQNDTIWLWRGVQLSSLGYNEQALEVLKKAFEIAPATGINPAWLGLIYSIQGKRKQARRLTDQGIALGWTFSHFVKAEILLSEDDFEGAKQALRNYLKGFQEPENGLDFFVDAFRDPALRPEAVARLSRLLEERRSYTSFAAGLILGQADLVVEYLETVSTNSAAELTFVMMPTYRKLLTQPAFKDYLNRKGIPELWRQNGWPDYCKPVGEEDFECD